MDLVITAVLNTRVSAPHEPPAPYSACQSSLDTRYTHSRTEVVTNGMLEIPCVRDISQTLVPCVATSIEFRRKNIGCTLFQCCRKEKATVHSPSSSGEEHTCSVTSSGTTTLHAQTNRRWLSAIPLLSQLFYQTSGTLHTNRPAKESHVSLEHCD